jgi:hypothetical protein
MNHETHRRIAEWLFPNIDPKAIDDVNKAIDSPTPLTPPSSPTLGQVPGFSRKGHHEYGHDVVTSAGMGLDQLASRDIVQRLSRKRAGKRSTIAF